MAANMAVVAVVLKTLFSVLGGIMVATLVYTLYIDGLPFRMEVLTPWMAELLVDFYINVVGLGAWVCYKESNFSALIWVVLLVCLGSITTCGYIIMQFFKLSSQESSEDPIYFVLLRQRDRDGVEPRNFCNATAKVLFSVLGCLMFGTLIYTILTYGSPFRLELFTPWVTATLIDFYINVIALSVWIAYKESSWISAFIWIALMICFGSITTCAYIVHQLFQLSSQDPVYLILFNRSNRAENRYEKT